MIPLTLTDQSLGITEVLCDFRSDNRQSDLFVFRCASDDDVHVCIAAFRANPPRPFHPALEKYAGTERTFNNATDALRYVRKLHGYGFGVPVSLLEDLDEASHAEGRAHESCCSRHRHHVIPHVNCLLR